MRPPAFLLETGKRIAPFDDPVGAVLVHHQPLRELQREALRELGFTLRCVGRKEDIPADQYPCLVLADDLYVSPAAVRAFLAAACRRPGSSQCAIARGTAYARIFAPFQDEEGGDAVRFPLYFLRSPGAPAGTVTIDIREHPLPFYLPAHMRGTADIVLPACVRPLLEIHMAADILFANAACLHRRFAEVLDSRWKRTAGVIRAWSRQPARVLARMNHIGPGCDIHPTARLEGAEIGAGVRIGAHAVVRMSSVGDGCEIGDGSVVKHSVLGKGCALFDDLTVGFAVCYPETFLIHGPYHLSVFGQSSAMFATILHDFRIDAKPIRLERNGRLVSYPFPFMGAFIGHRTRVAGGCLIGPGRMIPNDLLILPSPAGVLSRVPASAPPGTPLFIQNGTLEEAGGPAPGSFTSDRRDIAYASDHQSPSLPR